MKKTVGERSRFFYGALSVGRKKNVGGIGVDVSDVVWSGTGEEIRQMLARVCSSLIDLDISTSLRRLVGIVLYIYSLAK